MNTNQRIIHLCSNINGASMREIADTIGLAIDNVSGRLGNLQRAGAILKVRPPGKGQKCRFHATGLSLAHRGPGRPRGRSDDPSVRLSGTVKSRAKLLRDDAPVIITAATKRTVCPSQTHDPRYQVAPGAAVFGAGFAALGPGRDVTTGKAWA